MFKDDIGDRMKSYEKFNGSSTRFSDLSYIIVRIDGRSFSSFTKDLEKPFDPSFADLMEEMTRFLVKETGALIGYTQSDEASFLLHSDNPQSKIFFGGKAQKIISMFSALATGFFNRNLEQYLPKKMHANFPVFDARAFTVPQKFEVVNYFHWRMFDAKRNGVAAIAQHFFSHKSLQGKKTRDMIGMIQNRGISLDDFELRSRYGTFFQSVKKEIPFSCEEIEKLPVNHNARKDPNLKVLRRNIRSIVLENIHDLRNKECFLMQGEDPVLTLHGSVSKSLRNPPRA